MADQSIRDAVKALKSLRDADDWEDAVEAILLMMADRLSGNVLSVEPEGVCTVEQDGVTYMIPAALKGAFMRHADYTRKTMELAAMRSALRNDGTAH